MKPFSDREIAHWALAGIVLFFTTIWGGAFFIHFLDPDDWKLIPTIITILCTLIVSGILIFGPIATNNSEEEDEDDEDL